MAYINIPSFHDLEEGELLGFPFSTFLLSFTLAVRLSIDQVVIYRCSFSLNKDFLFRNYLLDNHKLFFHYLTTILGRGQALLKSWQNFALVIKCRKSKICAFVAKSSSTSKLGGRDWGGVIQFWQCQDFKSSLSTQSFIGEEKYSLFWKLSEFGGWGHSNCFVHFLQV